MEKFNLQVIKKRDHQHLMFAVNFNSTKPFGTLKRAVIDLLRRNSLFMNRHALDASTLDVTTTGWILGAHPRFHSPTLQKERMEIQMTAWWKSCSPDDRRLWETRVDIDPEGNMVIPDFYINARSIRARDGSGQSIQEGALLVVAPIKAIKTLTDLLEAVFRPTDDKDDDDDTNFIPVHLQRSDPKTYFKLVQQQGQYLEDFQNVSIAGVHGSVMQNLDFPVTDPTDGDSDVMTLAEALTAHPSITRLDPGSYVIPLGKWNLSTTKAEAEEAKKWIDHVLASMPVTQRCHTNFVDFPTVIRMQAAAPADTSHYSKLLKPTTHSMNPPPQGEFPSGPARPGRPFSQNPQEPEIPPLLHFESKSNTSTYARAATSKHSAATTEQNTGFTQISTITSEHLRGYENAVRSLRAEMRADMKAITEKLEARPTSTTTTPDQDPDNNNNQNGHDQPQEGMDTQLLLQEVLKRMDATAADSQAVLKRMDTHAATNQTLFDTNQNRFDALDEQQTGTAFQIVGINSKIDNLHSDNRELKAANSILMERLDLLEGAAGCPSPTRKFRRSEEYNTTPDGSGLATTEELLADADMDEATSHDGQTAPGSEVGSDPTASS
jgi:hypothetical protein